MNKRIIIVLGPPGSGKGTQARFLANILNIPVVCTGDILRRECESLGPLLSLGELVPDPLMNDLVGKHLGRPECRDGFILDGYPRTAGQAVYLDEWLDRVGLPRPEVLEIVVPEAQLIERLRVRQQCPACGRSYNDRHWAPAHRGFCDDDGMPLVRRTDDIEPVIRERLSQYETACRPILDHYRGPCLHRIDGVAGPGVVLEAIETALALYVPRR